MGCILYEQEPLRCCTCAGKNADKSQNCILDQTRSSVNFLSFSSAEMRLHVDQHLFPAPVRKRMCRGYRMHLAEAFAMHGMYVAQAAASNSSLKNFPAG